MAEGECRSGRRWALTIASIVATMFFASRAVSETNEESPEPELPYIYPTQPTIPYFSAAGRAYAKKHHLPPPPFRRGRAAIVDPPRDVAAPDWNGSFCRKWTDECTTCERDKKTGKPSCSPTTVRALNEDNNEVDAVSHASTGTAMCTVHAVKCTDSIINNFARVCQYSSFSLVERLPGQPEKTTFSTDSIITWVLSRRDHQWHLFATDSGDLPGPDRFAAKDVEYRGYDERCIHAVGEGSRYNQPVIER